MLIAEGRLTIIEVAKQMGHAPTMTLDTYGHVIAEMVGAERVSAEEAIMAARSGPDAPVVVTQPSRL